MTLPTSDSFVDCLSVRCFVRLAPSSPVWENITLRHLLPRVAETVVVKKIAYISGIATKQKHKQQSGILLNTLWLKECYVGSEKKGGILSQQVGGKHARHAWWLLVSLYVSMCQSMSHAPS